MKSMSKLRIIRCILGLLLVAGALFLSLRLTTERFSSEAAPQVQLDLPASSGISELAASFETSQQEEAASAADGQVREENTDGALSEIVSREPGQGGQEVSAPLTGPSEAMKQRYPPADLEELSQSLPPDLMRVFHGIREEFPGVDLTEVQAFHGLLSDKRETYGFELTDETVDLYRAWISEVDAVQRELVLLRGEDLGLSPGGIDAEGRGYALIGFEEGRPSYTFTTNVEAAISTGAHLVRWNSSFDPALGGTVDGSGLYVSVNDHGEIYEHTEFQLPEGAGSRIMVAEVPSYDGGNRNHMTHVAGTVSAWGYNSVVLGMSPRTWIRALIQQTTNHITTYGMRFPGEAHNEINPRTGEMQMKSVMGNTSLGTANPNTRYTNAARSFDTTLRDFPYYFHVYAASNDGPNFETLGGHNPIGKNVISIGAVQDVTRDADGNYVSGGEIAGFSSRGPAYDGRIKPDFAANGVGVRSTTGTTGNANMQGTSMASPNAVGSTLLLMDYVNQRFPGQFFRSSTYKALLMNTADDRGNPGPDYTFGWGIINVYAAGKNIRHHAENSYARVLREERLHPGQTWTYTYTSDGTEPIRASLAWLDVAGPAQTETSTDRAPRLVNDLDMRIIAPGGTVYEPFVMPFTTGQGGTPAYDDSLRSAAAVTGDNFTDPAEQILIPAPVAGTYTVEITHKGTLSGGQPQPFSLAVNGLTSAMAEPAVLASAVPFEGNNTDNFAMAVLGSGFVLGSEIRLRRDGSPIVEAYRIVPVGDRIDFRVDTAGIDKGYYDVVVTAPDGTESVLENGFLMPAEGGSGGVITLYSNTFENADGLALTGNWEVGVPNQGAVSGPDSAYTGSQVLGTYLNGNYENNLNIYATLPPISTVNRTNIRLEFRRWLGVAFLQTGNPNGRHRDDARIHYSLDGKDNWTQLWESNGSFNEGAWSQQSFNLPTALNNQSQVYLRFQLTTDGSHVSYGWNLDDLRITGESAGGVLLPPVFTSTPVTLATQGEIHSYSVTTSDEDTPADQLVLAAAGLPGGLSFTDQGDGTGLLSGAPSSSGTFEISLSVTDGDYTTWQVYELTVFPEGGNTPPVLLTDSLPQGTELLPYTAQIDAEDADGQALTFSTGPLPSWLSFTDHGDGTATLSGTPPVPGTHSISISVSDGFDTTEQTYELVIAARPILSLYSFTHAEEGMHPAFTAEDLSSGPAANAGGLNRFRTDEAGAEDTLSVVNNSSRTDVQSAFENNEYFSITLEPAQGRELNLASLDFKVTRGGTSGIRHFAVRSSLAPSVNLLGPKQPGSVRGSWDHEVIDLRGEEFQNLSGPVTFHFIVATDTTSASVEFDDITFAGTLGEGVLKETPEITQPPNASDLQEGQSLSASTLSGGAAEHDGQDVPGTFVFLYPDLVPPVGTGDQAVRFLPMDAETYYSVDLTVPVTVVQATAYRVFYEGNGHTGGSVPEDSAEYMEDALVTVLSPGTLVKTGHSFTGWRDGTAGVTYQAENSFAMPARHVTLAAQWTVNEYTITFDSDGGTAVDPITQAYGTEITVPLNPQREGYTFVRWEPGIPDTMPAENMTLTAQWQVVLYTVRFVDWDEREIHVDFVEYGSAATAPSDPVRYGYTFAGWDVPFDNVTSDLTVTAQYTLNPPSILTQPLAQTVQYGQEATLSVDAGGAELYYQWFQDNVEVEGATAPDLIFEFVRLENAGVYHVVVSNTAGHAESDAVALDVEPAPITVTALPVDKIEGEDDPPLTWEITEGQLFEEDAFVGELTRKAGEASGYYDILQGTLSVPEQYQLTYVGSTFTIWTVYGFVDSTGDGIDDDWWEENAGHFPEGADADTLVEQGGVMMKIRDIFIAGLDPADPADRFEFEGLDEGGLPVFTERPGREYQILWTDDLTKVPEEWGVWKAFDQAKPTAAPENAGQVFYRLDVRLTVSN